MEAGQLGSQLPLEDELNSATSEPNCEDKTVISPSGNRQRSIDLQRIIIPPGEHVCKVTKEKKPNSILEGFEKLVLNFTTYMRYEVQMFLKNFFSDQF